jgi:NAD+ synthase (glutamine-hydrolysing)
LFLQDRLRGYFTKYDCSSADLNPIGSISKRDLNSFIAFYSEKFQFPALRSYVIHFNLHLRLVDAVPTAELEPITDTYVQSDERDMSFSYEELCLFGKLRKLQRCGPVSMFRKACGALGETLSIRQAFHIYFN